MNTKQAPPYTNQHLYGWCLLYFIGMRKLAGCECVGNRLIINEKTLHFFLMGKVWFKVYYPFPGSLSFYGLLKRKEQSILWPEN